ncbi:unnamed protein product, partial [Tuber aestivum]
MSGAPGSGKSTMAKMLGCSIDGVVIDHDVIRSSLLKANTPFDQAAAQAYQLQWTLAQDIMKQGHSIIIDSTCNFQEVLDQGTALAKQHGFTYCQRTGVDCPPAATHGARAGQDSRALFQKWIDHPCRPHDNAVVVDSTRNLETLRDDVLKQIM